MVIVDMQEIEKSYGITDVLHGFSMTVTEGEIVALIGANGSGKTTVFKIIAGSENYDGGILSLKKEKDTGYLNQMPVLDPEKTLYQELEGVFSELKEIEERLEKLEHRISNNQDSKQKLNKLMEKYSQLQHKYEINDGYEYQNKIIRVASGLGFTEQELQKKTKVLSGGEKTRLGLIKLLLSEPDVLLLDEPTNHLDIPARQWLENYLNQDFQGTVLIISHDRYFLDHVVDRIVELKNGKAERYNGNYSYYLEERKRRYKKRMREYKNQQKKIKKMEAAINRLHRWGQRGDNAKLARRAKSMQKRLEKMEKVDKPTLGGNKMDLELDFSKRSGDEVLLIEDLEKSFKNNKLLSHLDLSVYWQDKSSIIGKNGTGKSTLLKMINGYLEPDSGYLKVGASVKIGYYSQEFSGFDPEDTLLMAFRREAAMSEDDARDALAAFLFTEDDVFKKIKDLSGGEKSRLRLLQLMNGDYNFLVLDEPTNHLDLPSREVLEEVLQDYPGTVLAVSHDRYFLNKFTDYVYELENGNLTKYYGDYDYYLKKKKELQKESEARREDKSREGVKDNYYYRKKREQREKRKREKKLNNIEEKIMIYEEKKETLEAEMSDPENLEDYDLLRDLEKDYKELNARLKELYKEWEELLADAE